MVEWVGQSALARHARAAERPIGSRAPKSHVRFVAPSGGVSQ
jgi:hypothetical protein